MEKKEIIIEASSQELMAAYEPVYPSSPLNEAASQQSLGNKDSFIGFIFRNKQNRRYVSIALAATVVQFTIFKFLYPFPDFFSDSYSYIYAAYANLDVSIWPIGYSKFLRIIHFFTYSDTALVAFQYFFFELGAIYFFFTLLYFYNSVRASRHILFIFLFFNPLFLYLCNYINSDPLFTALSLFWFTQLLWIMHHAKWYHIVAQAVLLFMCFTVRNNAYYYPFITAIAFALSHQVLWKKLAGASIGIILIIPFIIFTRNAAFKMTGTHQFSLFTGWQLANNALYIYGYINVDSTKLPSPQSRQVDKFSKQLYAIVPPDFHPKYLVPYVGNFFIREPYAPLKRYVFRNYKIADDYTNVVSWGKASVVFSEYGNYLIRHNLAAYFHKFILPNTKNYFLPPLEKLDVYNLGMDEVFPVAQQWFHYRNSKVTAISKNLQHGILYVLPSLFLLTNLYLLTCLSWLIYNKRFKEVDFKLNNAQNLNAAFQVANFCFCVSVTIIVFRYQVFPMITCVAFSLLLTEWLDKKEKPNKQTNVMENKLAKRGSFL